jgi:WD40 repeat protein
MATADADLGVEVWNVRDPAHPQPMGDPLGVQSNGTWSLVFSHDGTELAAGGHDDTIVVWNLDTRASQTLVGHTDDVSAIDFTPDGSTLVSASADGTTIIWDLAGLRPAEAIGVPVGGPVLPFRADVDATAIATSVDGRRLVNGGGTLSLWGFDDPDHPAGTDLGPQSVSLVSSAAFSPDGATVAVGGFFGALDLWSVAGTARLLSQTEASDQEILSMMFAPNGSTLATGYEDGQVALWSLQDSSAPKQIAHVKVGSEGSASTVGFSARRHLLAAAGVGGTVYLWDVTDPAAPHPLASLGGYSNEIVSVAFSPDATVLAAGGKGKDVQLWDISDLAHPRRLGRRLTEHTAAVTALTFTADGKTLLSSGQDGSAMAWNVADPTHPVPRADLRTPSTGVATQTAFSADASTLVTVTGNGVLRYDASAIIAHQTRPFSQACEFAGGALSQGDWAADVLDLPYVNTCP